MVDPSGEKTVTCRPIGRDGDYDCSIIEDDNENTVIKFVDEVGNVTDQITINESDLGVERIQQEIVDRLTTRFPERGVPDTTCYNCMDRTPTIHPDDFENVKGKSGKKNKKTGEIWEKDKFHKDHYEVYKNKRDYEKGKRDRSVWTNGFTKEKF